MAEPPAPTAPPPLRRLGPGAAGFLSLVVFSSIALVPFLGVVFGLLAPLPLVHFSAARRPSILAWGWVSVVLIGATLAFKSVWLLVAAAGYLAVAVWPTISIELWQRSRWSTGRWIAVVALVALALSSIFLVAMFTPRLPADALAAELRSGEGQAKELVHLLGGQQAGGDEIIERAITLSAFLVPSAVALYIVGAALWLRPRLVRLGFELGGEPFDTFASEEWLPVGFIVGGLAWVFAAGIWKWLGANLLVLVLGLYFVHGLAIIHFYLGRRLGANRWVRLAVAVFALQLPVAMVLSTLGLVDNFFTLRRGSPLDGGNRE